MAELKAFSKFLQPYKQVSNTNPKSLGNSWMNPNEPGVYLIVCFDNNNPMEFFNISIGIHNGISENNQMVIEISKSKIDIAFGWYSVPSVNTDTSNVSMKTYRLL